MRVISEVRRYAQFTLRLRDYLQRRITLEQAREAVQRGLAERETNFLWLVERGIFGNPRSPYTPLMKAAGCEAGDVRAMVGARGVEGTLEALRDAGVYVSFEEFKGRNPIVRNGTTISVRPQDFDNPHAHRDYRSETGGSTGPGVAVVNDLRYLAYRAPAIMLALDAHDLLGLPMGVWRGLLPDGSGIGVILVAARFGYFPEVWFTPITSRDFRPSFTRRFATEYIVMMARLFGAPIPWPRLVRLDQAVVVARWAAQAVKAQGGCLIRTTIGRAVRVCVAAGDEGIDLTGTTFQGGGEAPTPAKVREVTRSGARWVPNYMFSEAGAIGFGCARPADGNDVHVLSDTVAVIQRQRAVPGSDLLVEAFCYTTLQPTAPKLMLNVENDDSGVMESRSCGCPLEHAGFSVHLRHIRSFRKVTTEAVTLVGANMARIVEEILPSRFGGTPLDYQLVEEEDEHALTRLNVVVSPRIAIADEAAVIQAVLESVPRLDRATWDQAKTLRVKRMEPLWTPRGKFLPVVPLQLARRLADPNRRPT